jgi:hypothetical protein
MFRKGVSELAASVSISGTWDVREVPDEGQRHTMVLLS